MRANYKIPKGLKRYILNELYQYWENKRQLEELEDEEDTTSKNETGIRPKNQVNRPTENKALKNLSKKSTRHQLAIERKVRCIDEVYKRLNKEEQDLFNLMFRDGYSQQKAEEKGISYDTYYNTQNKIVYLTALEFGEI